MKATSRILFALALFFAGSCTDDEDEATPEDEEYEILKGGGGGTKTARIGLFVPLTGDSAKSGEQLKNAASLAFGEIDYRIGDYNIEIVVIDELSDSAGTGIARDNYDKAIKKYNLPLTFLNWHSAVSVDAMEVAAREKMAHLFGCGATGVVNERYKSDAKYGGWVKCWPAPSTYVKAYTDLFEDLVDPNKTALKTDADWTPPGKKIFLVRESGAWGEAFVNGAKAIINDTEGYWVKNGWSIYSETVLPSEDVSQFSTMINDAKAAGVSIVLGTSTADNVGNFAKTLKLNHPGAVAALEGISWGGGLGIAGTYAEKLLEGGYSPFAATSEAAAFQTAFQTKFGVAASSSSAGLGYDFSKLTIKVLERTIAKHSDITRANVLEVVENELAKGLITLVGGVVMPEYKYTADSMPDPVYESGKYYFPVSQYQSKPDSTLGTPVVYPPAFAGSNTFQIPDDD